jgi:hypothetical protein
MRGPGIRTWASLAACAALCAASQVRAADHPVAARVLDSNLLNPQAPAADWVALDAVAGSEGRVLWLLKTMSGRDAQGQPTWVVRGAMRAPPIPAGYQYTLAFCNKHGKLQNQVIAAVLPGEAEWQAQVHSAWRVDLPTLRITPLEPDGVSCYNTAFGAMHTHEPRRQQ